MLSEGAWPGGMVEMVGAERKAKGEMMKLGRRKLDILSLKSRILNGKLHLNYDADCCNKHFHQVFFFIRTRGILKE